MNCMKFLTVCVLFAFGLISLAEAADQKPKIRALVITGGHDFDQKTFYGMFDAMPDVEYGKLDMFKGADELKPGLEKQYDVLVFYDMVGDIKPDQRENLVRLLQQGIGVVALHHTLCGHRTWPEWRNIVGGTCPTGTGGDMLKIQVADKDHPITRGLEGFSFQEEAYINYYVSPKVRVLLKTDSTKNAPQIAWVHQYGKSRVFYLCPGHGPTQYNHPTYREVVARAIRWAAGRLD